MQHINYCYHAEKLTFNCHKGGKGRIMAKLFILSYSDAVSFRDIRGHLAGDNYFNRNFFIYALVVEGDYSRVTRLNPARGIKIGPWATCRRKRQKNKFPCYKSLPMLTHPRVPSF